MKKVLIILASCGAVWGSLAQEKKAGPIIQDYGKVWEIGHQEYKIRPNSVFKVVFDIMDSPEDVQQRNASIETAARFLNMHGQNGVSPERMKVALVVHNKASKDIITDSAYQKRFGTNNPNAKMVQQLMDAGVEFIFCGQSSLSRDFPKEETIAGVQLSLSAMTALIQLQNEGYRLIKF
ncbi:Hypothetical protein I595_457 [Croceitalea dokdonensis DOKDO 023]|uniref:Uncharacterized protein n=1 Tax=Croceitalea dokdonensis DOKDO 023 TaxID=1300341 RepID=A0A0P7A9L6_9FLAO|nr:DsrE family protein [Croceitalea dokdonensis]KPM33554.1 Hypothetical protein I595_457 [Croceitalea dokdonensis DOKDO 023]